MSVNSFFAFATWEQYLIYLRKSRQDDPRETVEEVLEKHETMLQEYAVREFGHKIPEGNIYREVVSGESIADRTEIKEILSRITDPNIKGVIVIEPSRLSRGDLIDCGHLIDAFRYSKTLVVTPYMTYDLDKKMERKFFQDELLRGNDYLEYTKEILWRGRVAAAKRGCYAVGGPAPFGYKKVKVGKDWILEVVPEDAEIVRMIFDWYVRDGISARGIAKRLTEMGIKTPSGKKNWLDTSIRLILLNKHYRGLIVFSSYRMMTTYENGEKVKRRVRSNEEDIIIAPGRHPAIIDEETFEAARTMIAPQHKTKDGTELKNPLASILRCAKCGGIVSRIGKNEATYRYTCRSSSPSCTKSTKMSSVLDAFTSMLETVELPALKLKIKNDEGNAIKIQQRLVAKLQAQLEELEGQEEKLYELVESGAYTPEMFNRRYTVLNGKIKACREELEKAKRAMPKEVNYQERVEALEEAIRIMKDPNAEPWEQNKLLKPVVDRIEYETPPPSERKYGVDQFTLKVSLRL